MWASFDWLSRLILPNSHDKWKVAITLNTQVNTDAGGARVKPLPVCSLAIDDALYALDPNQPFVNVSVDLEPGIFDLHLSSPPRFGLDIRGAGAIVSGNATVIHIFEINIKKRP